MPTKNVDAPKPKSVSDNRPLSDEGFAQFQRFLLENIGLVIGDGKRYLVESRLAPLLGDFRFVSLDDLVREIASGAASTQLRIKVIDSMTTNETSWFRDASQFRMLREHLLPKLFQENTFSVTKIWSAGCSTGQEPYSLSMTISDLLSGSSLPGNPIAEILGTDVATSVIWEARSGCYNRVAVSRGLESKLLNRYFTNKDDIWQVVPEISNRVSFRQLNLLDCFDFLGSFDLIFCRNVLIYFNDDNRRHILSKLTKLLKTKGHLFLASSESLPERFTELRPLTTNGVRHFQRAS